MSVKFCPGCGGRSLDKWLGGKLRCGGCNSVWNQGQLLSVPTAAAPTAPRKIAAVQEKVNAKRIGGRVTIGSGSTPVDKGDVKARDVLMECKYTEKASYVLKRETLEKLQGQANQEQVPVLALEFKNPSLEWYAVPKGFFLEMLDVWRKSR